ncbi:restriction endonuclease subunit S [Leuconostoc mesenteroides]|uniref:restriction endonuclease subunit S n=2 Tax=Leuconostoc TaxID=1243 RepID=UPI001CC0D7CF|nr:restriction endonuclease subunit S [Leuconostoc mesenteroides]MBZ1523360.1 restriction endonuclease subunit S [Leuconostoc mesenteroides]
MSKKTPQIRFKGFTDDWEERKLGEHSNILTGGTPKTSMSNYWNPKEIPWMSSGEVNKRRLNETDNMISKEGLENSSARWVKENSIVIALAGQGKTRGTVAVNNIPLTTNQSIAAIEPYETLNFEFIFQNLSKRYDELRMMSSGDGTRGGLNKKIIYDIIITAPILEEQQKIGSFFKQLDNTIALHQRKLDLLKEQKKGFLQKMFPKNGAKIPELRFAGFADDWEDRKLKDVTERVRSNDGRMDLPTLTMSASSGWLDQKDRFSGDISGKEKKNYTLLKKGELSYNHGNSKLAKYGVVFSLTNYKEALVPRVYHSFKALENTSADFIEYMFSTKLPDRELGKLVSSGARMDGLLNINYDDFMNIHISIPNYEEQILMSAFFRKLDETIALHQRKLDLLKEQKKGFLQKMFVS